MATLDEVYSQAVRCHQSRQFQQAEHFYRQVVQAAPSHADAWCNLGEVCEAQGKFAEAEPSYRRACMLLPGRANPHNWLGIVLARQGRLAEATASFHQALRLESSRADIHHNLAVALDRQGQTTAAINSYRHSLRLQPDFAQAHYNLGLALNSQGQHQDAIVQFQQALRLKPDYVEAFNDLGNAQAALHQLADAAGSYRRALELRPDFSVAHYNLGIALADQDKYDDAIPHFQRAIQLAPESADAHTFLGIALLRQGRLDQALACLRQAARFHPDPAKAQSNLMSSLNCDPKADLDALFEEHCRWGRAREQAVARFPHTNAPAPERHLRVGYVSPDFRFHPLARYFEPVLVHHDPAQVQVFCYAEVAWPDAVTARLQKLAHVWRSTRRQTDAEVAQQIRSDGIDILVDLAGHTSGSRLAVFAGKPAPVQAAWLGYMNTTGLTTMDYRLTDEVLDPPGQPVRDTEELLRLPSGMCCFAPPADAPPVTPLPALERGYLTFGSLSSLFKINAKVFDLWCNVLRAAPKSRLLMFHHNLQGSALDHARKEFMDRGMAGDRLDLRHGSAGPGYLGIYCEIDVSLDTTPYSGGVTTCEALWMGVPVLSLLGVRPAGRNSAALLTRVGLSHWAVDTPDQYVAFAEGLSKDLPKLAQLRAQLRDRMTETLCDSVRFTRELEAAYRTMWRRWCARKADKNPSEV